MLRPSSITAALNGTDLLNLGYTYDGDSNVTQLQQINVPSHNYTQTFTYDPLNRILSGSRAGDSTWSQSFDYNGDGSGGRYGNVRCTGGSGPLCTQLTFNPNNNRITAIGNQTPTYDAAGEMTSDGTGVGTTQYTWNAEGRTATVTPYGQSTATYVYDGDGHRVEDTLGTILFWYGAGGDLVGDTGGGTNNVQWIYFGGRRISKFVMSPAGPWGANFYDDADGSLRLETDTFGNANCRSDYYPFGEPVGSGCKGYESIQYAGLFTDGGNEDGNYSAGHRRYNYSYYRWFSPDPGGVKVVKLDNPQTWNMYAYVTDNPTTLNDPSGLYTAGCNSDVKNCHKQIERFDRALEAALKSNNAKMRAAAAAYGTLGKKNGVNVTFAKVVDPKYPNVNGSTSAQAGTGGATYNLKTGTFKQATQVTIKAGLGGSELEENAIHEGVHVENRAAVVDSVNLGRALFNPSLNISGTRSEINAFQVENTFRSSVGLPTLDIQDILSSPPYSVDPTLDEPLFPDLPSQ